MTHEYSNILFTAADHRSLCRAKKIQSTNSTRKAYVKSGREEITENLYTHLFAYMACAPVRFML